MEVLEFPQQHKALSPFEFADWAAIQLKDCGDEIGKHALIGVLLVLDENGNVHVMYGGENHSQLAEIGLYHTAIDRVLQRMHGG